MTKITIMAIYKSGSQHKVRAWLKSLGLKRAFHKLAYEYVDEKTLRNLEKAQLAYGLCFIAGDTLFNNFYQKF